MAILSAIDRDLDERGLLDRKGRPHYLLEHRFRVSRQLNQWLTKVSETIERQNATKDDLSAVDRATYIRELQRIALGKDSSASARDRLSALRHLLSLAEKEGANGEEDYASPAVSPAPEMLERTYEIIQESLAAMLENGEPDLKMRAWGADMMKRFSEQHPELVSQMAESRNHPT